MNWLTHRICEYLQAHSISSGLWRISSVNVLLPGISLGLGASRYLNSDITERVNFSFVSWNYLLKSFLESYFFPFFFFPVFPSNQGWFPLYIDQIELKTKVQPRGAVAYVVSDLENRDLEPHGPGQAEEF